MIANNSKSIHNGFLLALVILCCRNVEASIADRSRIVKSRVATGRYDRHRDNGRPIEGQSYRHTRRVDAEDDVKLRGSRKDARRNQKKAVTNSIPNGGLSGPQWSDVIMKANPFSTSSAEGTADDGGSERKLGQLTGCCYTYQNYGAADICELYGEDCEAGEAGSGDNDGDCSMDGLSFIGVSFSVNTANGNPYSYQLCDQFPMENIIDRDYNYVMSMDEDGWLVGGGYKTFDYSGKMPYIDSSHTELLRIGNMDPDTGGTSIDQVYYAMSMVSFSPLSIFPEYLKGGGGHKSNDGDYYDETPSGDVTLVVSVVETYEENDNYSDYDQFLDDLFQAMEDVGGGPCMDDHDTDPHVSMSRGVKFKSSTHQTNYMYQSNLEVAVWQAMYPNGVVIGSAGYASFPPGKKGSRQYVGYGNLYFFFDRANITKAYSPNRELSDEETYYATLFTTSDVSGYYQDTTEIGFDYGGSNDNDGDWEHNPYAWNAGMAKHDMTDGWNLPPNCYMEGETFLGIPLSRQSDSKMQSTSTFQSQFDFDSIVDRNYTYVSSFGTNHGWLLGEEVNNAIGSIVDKDTAHIPIFYTGTTNADLGGISLSNLIKVVKNLEFGALYIKPAFVFVDDDGSLKMQFEADSTSSMGYLYDTLCKELGISWNYNSPANDLGVYSNCAMHAAGDRATYGCGPENSNSGGFCPQMTLAYEIEFNSEDHAAAYLNIANNYVDYWRNMYPTGVAVGTDNFCPSGGCLGLFLNRYDLYSVFKPDLGGSWVQYNGASLAPTFSPAPTWSGGCNEPHNFHLDKCFQRRSRPRHSSLAWQSLGHVGQLSVFVISFMAVTLGFSLFIARARKKRRKGESYVGFFMRDTFRLKKKRKKSSRKKKKSLRRKLKGLDRDMEESMMDESRSRRSGKSSSRSRSRRSRTRKSLEAQTVTPSSATSVKSGRSKKSRSRNRSKNQSTNSS